MHDNRQKVYRRTPNIIYRQNSRYAFLFPLTESGCTFRDQNRPCLSYMSPCPWINKDFLSFRKEIFHSNYSVFNTVINSIILSLYNNTKTGVKKFSRCYFLIWPCISIIAWKIFPRNFIKFYRHSTAATTSKNKFKIIYLHRQYISNYNMCRISCQYFCNIN